jgi:hypothetical protein
VAVSFFLAKPLLKNFSVAVCLMVGFRNVAVANKTPKGTLVQKKIFSVLFMLPAK